MADFIYIAEARNGLVKIGCSLNPRGRVRQMELFSPVLIRLVSMWLMAPKEELLLHARFDSLRSHREWFRVEGPLVGFLDSVWGKGVDRIPEWSELTFRADDGPRSRLSQFRSVSAKARWADPEWRTRTLARMREGARASMIEGAA
ncbi:GIY-YIG nuclease family protein [Methylobacterium komagatae]|uniref:GIY-YIG nuclease family protein n=1 Tax=Methylobacterium komagatae TaxID=374425 RepID=A0ABW2BMJ2_9HYPH